jgi:4-amino-4-deoxy-L-arabinose transferase-like glycosyltransferase
VITLQIAAIVVVLLLAYVAGRPGAGDGAAPARVLDSPAAVAAIFAATFVVLWYAWAQWTPTPVVHDELAYVLQAGIFARGRWALPSPQRPLFFEQPYVLVEPALASKYFPGHSILLTLGAIVGWMPLMPLVLQSTAAAMMFVLARRVANGAVALLTWLVWLTSPVVLFFGPTYYSEATTIVCWLAGWYALLAWRTNRRLRWLLAVALCTGWCVITRPLTGLAYAIPVGIVVLVDVIRQRRWRDLALALAAGCVVLAIIPLWSARTTGDWRVTPLQRYTQDYMPYDLPGFGLITTPPARALNPEFVHLNEVFSAFHPNHQPAALPAILLERARYLADAVWGWSKGLYAIFALIGLLTLRGPAAFAVASGVLLLLVYLSFGTTPTWTLYYYESVPAYAYLTAAGIAWLASVVAGRRAPRADEASGWRSHRWTTALAAGALVLCVPGYAATKDIRRQLINNRVHLVQFARLRESIPGERALLFVRHAPWHNPHETLVQNVANPAAERLIVVYDRGDAENARLLALMPDRTPYLFDEAKSRVYRYGAGGTR